jgi:hypothetical protein
VRTSGFRDGFRIEVLRIAPFALHAASGTLRIHDRIRVRVTTGAASGEPSHLERRRTPRTTRADRIARVRASVDWMLGEPGPETLVPRGRVFRPTRQPSLEGSGVDLVVVTSAALEGAFDEFVAWKNALGTRTVVRTIEWIVATYEAPDVSARIREFLRDAYVHWGIEYAILAGDTNVLPIRYAVSRYNNPDGALIACDYYMACLDGDWNANGNHLVGEGPRPGVEDDLADLQPDIYVGRFPVDTFAEAQLVANKSMWYRGEDPLRFDDTYQETISFYAEALFWNPPEANDWPGVCEDLIWDGGALADEVYVSHMPPSYQANANMYYETFSCWQNAPYTPIPEDRPTVIADFDTGRHFVVHIGHGFRNNMAVGLADQKLFNADAESFTNGDRLSIVYAINCNSGAVDFDAIGEHFLLNDETAGNGGAAALVAATDLDYPSSSQKHLFGFMNDALDGSSPSIGETFFETSREEYASYAATTDLTSRWTLFSLILLGDPSLEMWSVLPQELSVDHPATYEMGSGPLIVSVTDPVSMLALSGVLVTAYKEGEAHVSALTDPSGTAVLDFEPNSVGNYTLGVTRADRVPRVLSGTVTAPAAAPHVVVADRAITEIVGNGDDVADVGETLSITVDLANTGGVDALDVALTASSASPLLTLIQGGASVGTVPAGGGAASTAIEVDVAPGLPAGLSYAYPELVLELVGSNGTWTRTLPVRIGEASIQHVGLVSAEVAGNGDMVMDVGERWSITPTAHNGGAGRLVGGTVSLESLDGGVAVVVSGAAPLDPAPSATFSGSPLEFDIVGAGTPDLEVVYADAAGELLRRELDFVPPLAPDSTWAEGGVDFVRVNWTPSLSADVQGYNVYREVEARGTSWLRVNTAPVRGGFHADLDLAPLTPFRFRLASVDSAGNEGAVTTPLAASTAPPASMGFPVSLTGAENRGSPTVVDLDQDGILPEVLIGSDYLYVLHGDGTEYLDGDGQSTTLGLFTEVGHLPTEPVRVFWTKPAVADIDLDGTLEIIVGHMESARLYCFDADGNLEWGGGTHYLGQNLWSSPAIGNVDNDPELEVILWSGASTGAYRGALIGFNHDGTEITDGDSNAATNGIIAKSASIGAGFNYSSVALFDVDHDGRDEIMAGERFGSDGLFYVLDVNGTDPISVAIKGGWPYDPTGGGHQFTSSPALADADGDGEHEIYAISKRGLHALEWTGAVRAGYPHLYTQSELLDFNDFLPSPVLGEFDGDGELDVVHGWENGLIYAYTAATGTPLPGFPIQLSIPGQAFDRAVLNGSLVDVDDDPEAEFVVGTGGGDLYAINADGTIVGGFPYSLGGAIFGAPAIYDLDQNGSIDIVFSGVAATLVSIEMTGVAPDPISSHWPQWRHDPRNSGVYRADVTVDVPAGVPPATRLLTAAPNPFTPRTTIRYDIGGTAATPVRLSIFDVTGRRVADLVNGHRAPGAYRVTWDGTDGRGRRVGSGVYFYRLTTGSVDEARRMVLVE